MIPSYTLQFVVPGTPVGWQRADSKGRQRYDTPRNKAAKAQIGMLARVAMGSAPIISGPVVMSIRAEFEPAKSWSKRQRERALGNYHCQKPDRDNIEKLVSDALKGVVWVDDCQVADGTTTKRWGPIAQTTIIIREVPWPS